jgi:hypothetical protein
MLKFFFPLLWMVKVQKHSALLTVDYKDLFRKRSTCMRQLISGKTPVISEQIGMFMGFI